MKQSHRKSRKEENTKRKTSLLYYGERSKNSVRCGVAGGEIALEFCVGASEAARYASAKRVKVSCEEVLHFLEC